MTSEKLTEAKAIESLREFFRSKPFLFFGSGMSCALDIRFGMPSLKDALIYTIQDFNLTESQKTEWDNVVESLNKGLDLENSLNSVNDNDLLKILTKITGNFVANVDKDFSYKIAQGSAVWPVIPLLKKLVDTLSEGDPILHALTPNYDMLFEYSCEFAGIPYTNGFFGGVERKKEWKAVDRALLEPEKLSHRLRVKTVYKYKKHVRLYKVHGSLNYFFHRNSVIENNAWMWHPPDFAERVMITPGLSKYQTLQRYRQELLQSADSVIEKATHFLFLGYGFNDQHLEEYIKRKLINHASHGLIVTRDSNPRIESLLHQSDNLWLICKTNGRTEDGSRIFNRQYLDWLILPGKYLWNIGDFIKLILGD